MKKWLSLLLTLAILLSMTACNISQPAPTEASQTEAPTEEVSSTEYLPYEGEKLTVLYLSGGPADAARSLVADFEAATGASVEVVEFSCDELHEQALLDLVSYIGTYDVINVNAQWDGEFAPYLESLDNYIAQDNYDTDVLIENVLANCGQWQNSIIGIPTSCMAQVFAYRTDLMPNGIPKTWLEYRRALTYVNRPATGVYGIAVSKASQELVNTFNLILWTSGGNWADEEWNVTVNSTPGRAALTHMSLTKTMSDPACYEWTNEDAIQAFLEGKAAVLEAWPLPELLQKADDPEVSQIVGNWALALIPQEQTGITPMTAWNVAIPVGSQNKDLAWEWIKMYTDSDVQNRFYDDFGIFSPHKDFWEQEKMANLSIVREALELANVGWRIPSFREAEPIVSETLLSFLSNQMYQDATIRQLDADMKGVLENVPFPEGTRNFNH